ncbi:glutamate receptor ionotropic, delta-2 isoform X1 [Cydia pomonella]|uniref:Putative ionotropic receptor IR76b n=3 Tax=Cydia pomonella TaxID=82600 RepID=H9A5S5_CYDPO|nr:glutamate receptor ionotropic, delta-2 isoform X1 [Cydia pomonella]AFC91765.1 putative ionotropic receptor IR76b [Cydia pomonella]
MTGLELIVSSICNATFCEVVYDNPITDTLLPAQKKELLKIAEDLNGKHLKIGTYDNYPLSWVHTEDNGKLTGRGVAFVVLDILRERFNFTFDVVTPLKNFEIGIEGRMEDSLIGLVNSSQVDMAAAFLPIVYKYQQFVDFSSILDKGVWMMMLQRPKESAAGSGLLAPFEIQVWYLILAAVLSYGPCITLLTYLRSKLVRDGEKNISLTPSFWFVYGALLKQGTTLAPEANTTRILFTTWWLFIILLSAFYTANLTAFLTLSKFTLDVEYPEDLYKKNYRWVAPEGSTVQYVVNDADENLHFLSKMVANGRAEFRSVNADRQYLPYVMGGAVLVKEQTAIHHLMFEDYLKKTKAKVPETKRCTYVVAPNPFMEKLRSFAFPKNSKLKLLFDPVLTYLLQSGIVTFLEFRDLPSTKICPLDLQSKDRKLRNSDLSMTYMLMGVGLATAIAVFGGEMIIRYYVRIKIRKNRGERTRTKTVKTSKHRRFRIQDDSHPPPYDSLFGQNSRYKMNGDSTTKIINGREYWVVGTVSGDIRFIPVRTPSAFLYQRDK